MRAVRRAIVLAAGCGLAILAASARGAPASGDPLQPRVTGSINYLQRMALPPAAVITVRLVDVSRADAPATVIGEQVSEAAGRQVPIRFEIPYDAARIDPRAIYAVQARIETGGRLLFVSDRRYTVITRGAGSHADMVLQPVGGAPPR